MALYLCGLSPKNPQPKSYEKHLGQISVAVHPVECSVSTPQSCQNYPKQGKPEKLP